MDELCGALDPDSTEMAFYCTLTAGHDPGLETVTHRTDYRKEDPDNPPATLPAVHEWAVTATAPA